jgi:hypothetical protein
MINFDLAGMRRSRRDAGVFGYLGYDMVRHMERLPPAKPDPIGEFPSILREGHNFKYMVRDGTPLR